jgi:hypothetical protein
MYKSTSLVVGEAPRRSTSSLGPNEMSVSVSLEGRVESFGDDLVAVIRTACRGLFDMALDVSFDIASRSRLFPC